MTPAELSHLRRQAERNRREGEQFTVVNTYDLLELLIATEAMLQVVDVVKHDLAAQAAAVNQLGGLP